MNSTLVALALVFLAMGQTGAAILFLVIAFFDSEGDRK